MSKKLLKSYEVKKYEKEKRQPTQNEVLKKIGYKKETEYSDCVSFLAW
jgi:hypothetical protein